MIWKRETPSALAGLALAALIVTILPSGAVADDIQLTVTTDKYTYLVGEDITISVTAYNPGGESVTLTFPSTLQGSYIMDDDAYDFWGVWGGCTATHMTEVTLPPESSHTWELEHDWGPEYYPTHSIIGIIPLDMLEYDPSVTIIPLDMLEYDDPRIGTHSVIGIMTTINPLGGVIPLTGYTHASDPAQFEVVPEPTTLSLVVIGGLVLIPRRRQ